uniref:ribosomalproteinL32 n=1 Tax=Gyrinops versteegii TaxID=870953 RepID=UPI002113A80B|nr:ribosomalproteinL32 [Gyrinops versteegii]USN93459.1 ribosomalproteinL32 [Gyrinops versteegii]BBD75771.1 ribosomal protein L32 [Gyrinops versteegii]
MAVPKKRTSRAKKLICKNIWKNKAYWAALKAFSFAKSVSMGNSKSFSFYGQGDSKGFLSTEKNNKTLE